VIAVVSDRRDDRYGWRLVGRTGLGADVLARPAAVPAPVSCRQALEGLRDGAGVLSVVAAPDGHFKWQLTGPDTGVIAESPPIYRDPATCHAAFTDARRAARAALGAFHVRPPAGSVRPRSSQE
jgi:hypothetical protein